MLEPEPLLAQLHALRKEYQDDVESPEYLALHHAFLFISYNIGAFKAYVASVAEKEAKKNS